ncbi:hypothetical protein AVEN_134183-1 [Araneus ventricosus]|uniref:Endonuclease/exonuclease/phosphatase domain-containing protein n=1 Tax=Araneus ventricosus TaxID=182803 RepID=A0A4Y2VHE2_ARAVE|nr:hypothetical protein AVEN_134183-1 [Araneus ventricosus]
MTRLRIGHTHFTHSKCESLEENLWKNNIRRKIVFAYNPPGNNPLNQILENALDRNTIIIWDFNSHSLRLGYKDVNQEGKIMEDFLDSSAATLIQGDGQTFLSFKGEKTNPDLTISHSNIHGFRAPGKSGKVMNLGNGLILS